MRGYNEGGNVQFLLKLFESCLFMFGAVEVVCIIKKGVSFIKLSFVDMNAVHKIIETLRSSVDFMC